MFAVFFIRSICYYSRSCQNYYKNALMFFTVGQAEGPVLWIRLE